jgi:hypothetical protein
VHRFGRLHFEVLASKVQQLHMLQDRVYVLSILEAKADRIAVMQFELVWLEVHEFGLLEHFGSNHRYNYALLGSGMNLFKVTRS